MLCFSDDLGWANMRLEGGKELGEDDARIVHAVGREMLHGPREKAV